MALHLPGRGGDETVSGKTEWAIGDGFMNNTKNGNFESHEAICVLNTSDTDAEIKITVYFEDKEPIGGFNAICPARRTNHIRLDKISNDKNEVIPRGVPYALFVESSAPVVVQHSRMDVSQAEMTLMTTMAY